MIYGTVVGDLSPFLHNKSTNIRAVLIAVMLTQVLQYKFHLCSGFSD